MLVTTCIRNLPLAIATFSAAHGAQYYVMMAHLSGGRENQRQSRRLFVAVPLLGLAVGWPVYALGVDASGVALGVYTAVVAAHFVVDAGVWKLRDPQQRAYMKRRFSFL